MWSGNMLSPSLVLKTKPVTNNLFLLEVLENKFNISQISTILLNDSFPSALQAVATSMTLLFTMFDRLSV